MTAESRTLPLRLCSGCPIALLLAERHSPAPALIELGADLETSEASR